MKNQKMLLIRLALFVLSSCSEVSIDPASVAEFTIKSATNGSSYSIRAARPDDFFTSGEKYAVIYVLDGEENFSFVAQETRQLSSRYGVQNPIVVSIGYGNDRNLDYTPTRTGDNTGGGPEFLQFIKDQLIPKMEQEFRADTARSGRVILGHSFGGLFGAYAFGADNALFGNYLMLSPSLWYDNEICNRLEAENRSENFNTRQLVFIGGGELENSGRMQAPVEGFYNALKGNYTDLRITRNIEEGLSHMGSKNPNIRKGLEFYFQNR